MKVYAVLECRPDNNTNLHLFEKLDDAYEKLNELDEHYRETYKEDICESYEFFNDDDFIMRYVLWTIYDEPISLSLKECEVMK